MLEEYKNARAIWEENYDSINLRSDILITERILGLLGDVRGKKILDLGCGNGKPARALTERGANVVGVDISREQINFSLRIEQEKNQGIRYFTSDLLHIEKIGFPLESFDIIVSLMVHLYLTEADFIKSFSIIAKFLNTAGQFVYGNIHPARIFKHHDLDYLKTYLLEEHFPTVSGKIFTTRFYHHPLGMVMNSITDAGLCVKQVYEPQPNQAELRQYPDLFDITDRLPQYLIINSVKC